jgi:coenzyme F420-0:L-glutamate ligase / coenzyme F420-1:gamma-L-glutamate ligase
MRVEISALSTLPEIRPGDDLSALIRNAAQTEAARIDRGAIVAVAQKAVSKAENAIVDLRQIQPSRMATAWAEQWNKNARLIEVILSQSKRIVKMERGVLIAETRHGFVCANAGVDQSNTDSADFATILPADPDDSARRLRDGLGCGAVIVTDSFGRPWREGLVDVAIGVAGLDPLIDCRGTRDRSGRTMTSTVVALGDQLAAAAGLLMSKANGCPVVVIHGFAWQASEGSARALIRRPEQDLFR